MNDWLTIADAITDIPALSAAEVRDALDELAQHGLIEFDEAGVRFRLTPYGMAQARRQNRANRRLAHHRRGQT